MVALSLRRRTCTATKRRSRRISLSRESHPSSLLPLLLPPSLPPSLSLLILSSRHISFVKTYLEDCVWFSGANNPEMVLKRGREERKERKTNQLNEFLSHPPSSSTACLPFSPSTFDHPPLSCLLSVYRFNFLCFPFHLLPLLVILFVFCTYHWKCPRVNVDQKCNDGHGGDREQL